MKRLLHILLALLLMVSIAMPGAFAQTEAADIAIIPVSEGDTLAENIDNMLGYASFETERGLKIAPVLDVQGYFHTFTNFARIDGQIRLLSEVGFTRLYMVICGQGYPAYAFSGSAPSSRTNYLNSLIALKQDPHKAYADACHKYGLEIYAIYKPYEGGGGVTAPSGKIVKESAVQVEDIGGTRLFFDTFLQNNLDMRVKRKPDDAYEKDDRPITSVEFVFIIDSYYTRNRQTARHIVSNLSVESINAVKSAVPSLWTSGDNGQYSLYKGGFDYTYTYDMRVIKDANGYDMFGGQEKRCIILAIDGISLTDNYLAVTFDKTTGMRTIPYSMINIFSGNDQMWSTVTTYVRKTYSQFDTIDPENYVWGREPEPAVGTQLAGIQVGQNGVVSAKGINDEADTFAQNFHKWGFEFNWFGIGFWGEGWATSAVYGIARGKIEYLPGAHCEAYPEVREFWLDTIEKLLDAGYDGIDIRLQAHSAMVCDYVNYGYNEPIVQRYKELYGVDILTEDADPIKLMKIRGDFFIMFLEDAAELIHSRGAKLQMNLRGSYVDPVLDEDINEIAWWTMPKIIPDWRRCVELSDAITIKDYIYSDYETFAYTSNPIKEYAHELGKEVWIHCYDQQAGVLNEGFFGKAISDPLVDGVLIYEINFRYDTINRIKYMMDAVGARKVPAEKN